MSKAKHKYSNFHIAIDGDKDSKEYANNFEKAMKSLQFFDKKLKRRYREISCFEKPSAIKRRAKNKRKRQLYIEKLKRERGKEY